MPDASKSLALGVTGWEEKEGGGGGAVEESDGMVEGLCAASVGAMEVLGAYDVGGAYDASPSMMTSESASLMRLSLEPPKVS